MSNTIRGTANTLSAEWRLYQGGPLTAVTGVTITITPLSGGAPVLGPTTAGVTTPATGVNVYAWTPDNALPLVQYLVTWTGQDTEGDTVTATEILSLSATSSLGGPYSTRARLKSRMGIPDSNTTKDTDIDNALLSASDAINRWCHRQFGQASEATTRTYIPGWSGTDVDDFWTTDDLLIGGVAYDPEVISYGLEPVGGVVDGVPGWPYNRLTAWNGYALFPTAVTVTARWGWENIPAGVQEACLLLAADDLKSADAPFGVAGFGDYVVRVRANPKAAEKLAPYIRNPIMVAS